MFAAGSLLALGLTTPWQDAVAPLVRRRFVLVTLIAGWLVCPGIAQLLLAVVPLERPYATGLLVLSLAPAAPSVPALARIARADPGHTAAFMVLATVATVVIMPAALQLMLGGPAIAPAKVALPLVGFVLVPLLAGLLVRSMSEAWALRLSRPVTRVVDALRLVLLAVVAWICAPALASALGTFAIATVILFVTLVTCAAYAIGALLPEGARRVLTLGLCSRNFGAALTAVSLIEPDPRALIVVVMAPAVTVAGSIITSRWLAARRAGFA